MKLSIITPLYYGDRYIDNLVNMIDKNAEYIEKKRTDIIVEFIVVNDSPECTIKIPDMHNKIAEVIYIVNERNVGIHQTRINGLKKATGDYILFLDQDDVVSDDFAFEMCERALKDNSDVILCNAIIERKDTKYVFFKNEYAIKCATKKWAYLMINDQLYSPGQCIIRKNAIPEEWYCNILNVNGADDYFLWILLLCKEKKFTYVNKCMYTHCYTGENISDDLDHIYKSVLSFIEILKNIDYVPKNVISKVYNCATYKNRFRKTNIVCKLLLSIRYVNYAVSNVVYRIKCRL